MYKSPFDDPNFRVPDLTLSQVELLLRDNAETITQLLGVVKEWFIPMMYHYSEEYWSAGWLDRLDTELPKVEKSVGIAARLLGEIPFWNDSVELDTFDPDPVEWRKYDVS